MMGFLKGNGVYTLFSDEKQQKNAPKGAALAALLALKPGL
jgi:hypothetical protein